METTLKDFKGRRAIEIQRGVRTEATAALDQDTELMAGTRLAGSQRLSQSLWTQTRVSLQRSLAPPTQLVPSHPSGLSSNSTYSELPEGSCLKQVSPSGILRNLHNNDQRVLLTLLTWVFLLLH